MRKLGLATLALLLVVTGVVVSDAPAVDAQSEVNASTVRLDGAAYWTSGTTKCLRRTTASTIRLRGVDLDVFGFCASPRNRQGITVRLHMATSTSLDDVHTFFSAIDSWALYRTSSARVSDAQASLHAEAAQSAFTDSTELGFATKTIRLSATVCNSVGGWYCQLSILNAWTRDGDLWFRGWATIETIPATPGTFTASRNADYDEVTLAWDSIDPATQYQVDRLTAVQVGAGDSARIEYGDPVQYEFDGGPITVKYVDSTAEANRTYQYRIRARGVAAGDWSDWTDYVFSGAVPEADIGAPTNVQLSRDDSSVTVSWTAPVGEFDNYTVQRQELAVVEGSTFFANVRTFSASGSDWLPSNTTTYTDSTVRSNRTYEYRVAAVLDDATGEYTEWSRVTPVNNSLGPAPQNFMDVLDEGRIVETRREFWMQWDPVGGADDYEVAVMVYERPSGAGELEVSFVSDTQYFRTSYGRVELRVRGRQQDDDLCGSGAADYCHSEWSEWRFVNFTPVVSVPSPPTVDASADADLVEFRADTEEAIEAILEPAGAQVDASVVLQFGFIVMAFMVAGLCIALSWKRGMVPLGFGMGFAAMVLVFFIGYRLYGIPLAWPVAAQTLVGVLGMVALVRQIGIWR